MNLEHITKQVSSLTKEIGSFIRTEAFRFSSSDVIEKAEHDLVSYVDREAENRLVAALAKVLPDAGFIAEENPELKPGDQFNWIVDPLDGTTNFVHGLPVYSISVALHDGLELVSGVIYEINLDECFSAWKGGPALLNEKSIKVSQTDKLHDSLLATGFPYRDFSLMEPYLELFDDLMRNTRGIRRLGSAAVDLAYVACGRFEVFYEYGLHPWDVAAGALIVERAGGLVTDFNGGSDYLFGKRMVASNGLTHPEFMNKVNRYFNDR
jgi:myo-inositol-1(or 4)-monophosphatase